MHNLPILSLAFVGDSVFDLWVREKLVMKMRAKVNNLHKGAISIVNATAQAKFFAKIKEKLSDEEFAIYNRGKNAKSTPPRNADPKDYAVATGFEAVLGWLHLTGQHERVEELLEHLLENIV